jgi:hypothetical protein
LAGWLALAVAAESPNPKRFYPERRQRHRRVTHDIRHRRWAVLRQIGDTKAPR